MLNTSKLKKIKHRGTNTIAQCPACHELDMDHKGDHLWINQTGAFSCVINPGLEGSQHRKRIFELVGIKDKDLPYKTDLMKIYPAERSPPMVLKNNILGQLGHLFTPNTQQKQENHHSKNVNIDLTSPVPNVPNISGKMVSSECISKLYQLGIEWNKKIIATPNDLGKTNRK